MLLFFVLFFAYLIKIVIYEIMIKNEKSRTIDALIVGVILTCIGGGGTNLLTDIMPHPTTEPSNEERQLFLKNLALVSFEEKMIDEVQFLSEKEANKYKEYQKFYLFKKQEGERHFIELKFYDVVSFTSETKKKIHAYVVFEDIKSPKIIYQEFNGEFYNTTLILPQDVKKRLDEMEGSD